MVDSQPFTICKVSWLTDTRGNEGRRDEIVEHFYHFAKFLQDHELARHHLVEDRSEIGDEFEIRSDDLTPEGMAVVRDGYDKWLRQVDKGMPPSNVRTLERSLAKIRSLAS